MCHGEVSNTFKSEVQQPGRITTVDYKSKERVYISWNVRGITDKEEELDELLKERHIKITCISEK
jgi:hypothetical protein